jgi:phosphoglycolate phosphatase-like HAD superfamily hydrolase
MIVIPSNKSVWFDVDDTLVMWDPSQEELDTKGIEIECPAGFTCVDGELTACPKWKAKVVPHEKHIQMLKLHKLRGHTVVVWSAGGYDWAEVAVKALKLEQYVDLVVCKPTWAYDDQPPERILPSIQWKEDK